MAEYPLSPGELLRLAECVREPIRFPGAVQQHGVVLVLDSATLRITHASDNAKHHFGMDAEALLDVPVVDVFGDELARRLADVLDPESLTANPVQHSVDGRHFDVVVHREPGSLIVEFESLTDDDQLAISVTRAAFRRLAEAQTVAELWRETAVELQRITGFDRVMVYHFHPDAHGEVVAEVAAEGMERYLGLHYPASDIPEQARQLYLTKRSRLIASSVSEPAALVGSADAISPELLDLSAAELRAVSPHHREFMRNMGQHSTLSLSIIRGGELVGMITCAHRTERRLSFNLRDGLEILANQISLQLYAMTEIERLARRNTLRDIRGALVGQVDGSADLHSALLQQHVTILDLIPADGGALVFDDRLETIGDVPAGDLRALVASVAQDGRGVRRYSSESLPLSEPAVAELMPGFAGILIEPIGADGGFIAWFRREITQTVNWLGDLTAANRATPLSPRNSFSSWSQDVTGTAAPWDDSSRQAVELARDLNSALLGMVQAQLAEMALRDPLTGLPNRRVIMDRIDHAIERHRRGAAVALLFLDLDRFKLINDTLGHAAGDAALISVAAAIESATRKEDSIARLGGDEFVVLCEDTTADEARAVAQRIREAIEATTDHRLSASIGIAMADPDYDASHFLTEADAAMYRTKQARATQ